MNLILIVLIILVELVLLYITSKDTHEQYATDTKDVKNTKDVKDVKDTKDIITITPQNNNVNNKPIIAKNNFPDHTQMSFGNNPTYETCQRCRGDSYDNVWNGYQMAPSPPPVFWPDRLNAEGHQTKAWQNYKVMSTPMEETQFHKCDDEYRCRRYGVATGVQGKF